MDWNDWKERENLYACWLCNYPGIGNRQLHRLTELCGSAEAAYFADRETWGKVLSPKQAEGLKSYTAAWKPEEQYQKMREEGIALVTVRDRDYPGRLREIPDAPFGIFYRGRLPGEEVPAVAVIGARECSEYGKYVAKELGKALARNGIVLVSGMAKGIDGISQQAALDAGGYSVGVLGSGVDICYPAQNKELYGKLAERGAVLSSYPIGTQALGRNFPPRNRIVSGLADAVVVIEARTKSGTLITVDMALEQGREVYVVPGRVTDRLSDGCNRLIKQGAGVLLGLEEFLEEIRELRERKRERPDREGFSETTTGSDGIGRDWEQETEDRKRLWRRGKVRGEKQEPRACRGTGSGCFAGGGEPGSGVEAHALSGGMAAVYEILDFTPKSAGEIQAKLSKEQEMKSVAACLMRLVMENYAIQVSPGYFCRKGEEM